ncbi:DUF3419 family protein [Fundidesulfovibrio agrisoli]|uniref:DUF3419 family protein n=1 Tax=Fundidesulfovibrio agrisoli TaxID=2922717 RepID=UPI001FAB86E9|nr:BtaA family protein [Fundidesulfovibrio agrisoli]
MSQSCTGLLKAAVSHSPAFSRQGVLERLFVSWFSGFVYNQIWEDPRVDLKALELETGDHVVTIASGGCNICHYLLGGAGAVTAVDLNSNHVHLSRLKLEAARRLPTHEAFFRFFGRADDKANVWAFSRHIEPHLPRDTAAYWLGARSFLGAPRIEMFAENIYEHARMGRFLRLMRTLCRVSGRDPQRILKARSMDDQREAFKKELEPLFTGPLARLFSGFAPVLYSLGVPPQQYKAMERECPGGMLEAYRERVEKLACGFPLADNPFAWQAFGRRYDKIDSPALPAYLRSENFQALKEAAPAAKVLNASLIDWLERQPARSLDRYVLLDSQDWMTPELLGRLWAEIARTSRSGARVIFRTAGESSPLERQLPPALLERFHYDEALSRELTPQDRSCLYGGFHLYRFAG